MATYAELYDLNSNSPLRNKIAVAATIRAAEIVALASPTAAQIAWASKCLASPLTEASRLMPYVLAANAAATSAQISNATDATIQTAVTAAVDKLIAGGVA